MKSNSPFTAEFDRKDERPGHSYRFIDEKISDESGTESQSDSALKPAGLNNPFWK
jgi:hypothetical protein